MKRAYLIEMGIFRSYAFYLLGIGFPLTILVGVGMQTAIVAPAILTCMYLMMGSMGVAAYDDQNGWGRYRLTLPVSKRDVVMGRYAAIVTLGLIGTVVGVAASLAVMGVASVVELPGGISESLALNGDRLTGMAIATAVCILIGSLVASVMSPMYFKFGQTKATQLLPTVIVILFVTPVVILGNSGVFSEGADLGFATDFLAFLETPLGTAVGIVALLGASAALLAISAAVSLRLYAKREL